MDSHKEFWHELEARGFIAQSSDLESLKEASQKPLTLYIGADATAKSFHAGHLVFFMLLRHFQRAGHRVLFLLGGATTRIGDPSDKRSARPLLEEGMISQNVERLLQTTRTLLKNVTVVNNQDWLCDVKYVDFLRDVGRHFSVNRMLGFDFIKSRLEANLPLSFLEMNYILMQSYDFLHLHDHEGCTLQVGGQDQWANIISGVDLIRRLRQNAAYALTYPLLTTSDGQKMGKTQDGAVWLNADLFSPYDFWQFWRNTNDQDVIRLLRLLTFIPLNEIDSLAQKSGQALNEVKIILADHITRFVHGEDALKRVHAATKTLFQKHSAEKLSQISDKGYTLTPVEAKVGFPLIEALLKLGFASSKGDARRLIRGGGVYLNDQKMTDEACMLFASDFKNTSVLKLSAGKKRHGVIKYS
jgi:tyrosyl-tRNA synthetase